MLCLEEVEYKNGLGQIVVATPKWVVSETPPETEQIKFSRQ